VIASIHSIQTDLSDMISHYMNMSLQNEYDLLRFSRGYLDEPIETLP
jgi:hypothetical protein